MTDHAEYLGATTAQFTKGKWYYIHAVDSTKKLYKLKDDWGLDGWFPREWFQYYSEIH